MSGMTDLDEMLTQLEPVVREGGYVYVQRPADALDDLMWESLEVEAHAVIIEAEGTTLVVEQEVADDEGLGYEGVFGWITLQVHSSLSAVGLTAAVSTALARAGIACNMLAGFHHDHLLVPLNRLDDALDVLDTLADVP